MCLLDEDVDLTCFGHMLLVWLKAMLNSAVRPASRQVDKAGNDAGTLQDP